ncbi:MAG: copper resistance protein NlpE [Balneola sp.]
MKYLSLNILVIFVFTNCINENKNEIKIPDYNSKESLDWVGVYAGVLPCEGCEGVQTKLTLTQDNTFGLERTFLGSDKESVNHYGSFEWNSNGTKIKLLRLEKRGGIVYFMVIKNQLIQLTSNAERYPEEIEREYILRKR